MTAPADAHSVSVVDNVSVVLYFVMQIQLNILCESTPPPLPFSVIFLQTVGGGVFDSLMSCCHKKGTNCFSVSDQDRPTRVDKRFGAEALSLQPFLVHLSLTVYNLCQRSLKYCSSKCPTVGVWLLATSQLLVSQYAKHCCSSFSCCALAVWNSLPSLYALLTVSLVLGLSSRLYVRKTSGPLSAPLIDYSYQVFRSL